MGPAAVAAMTLGGSVIQDFLNRGESKRNRQFQERMRNTQWQAGIADMRAAGLNPALAYSQGPAASPSGSMAAPAGNYGSSAIQGLEARKQLQLMTASIAKTEAEAEMAQTLSDRERVRNIAYGVTRQPEGLGISFEPGGIVDETKALIRQRIAEAGRAESMAQIAGMGGQIAQGFGEVMPAFQSIMGIAGQGADQLAGVVNVLERAARMRDEAVRQYLGIPKAAVQKLLETLRRARSN